MRPFMNKTPLITYGVVTGQDAANHKVYVVFRDGGQLAHPVYVLFNGPADGCAVNQVELPRVGTSGIVLFPNDDFHNGIWIGSYYSNLTNAITSDSTHPFENFFSHWNGAYEYMDQIGSRTIYSPDGSYFRLGQGTILPTIFKNTGTPTASAGGLPQVRSVATNTPSGSAMPAAFSAIFKHTSGTFVQVTNTGSFSVSAANAQTLGLSGNGASINLSASGAVSIAAKSGQTVTVSANGSTVVIDASGNVNVTLAGGTTFNINGTSDNLALVSLLVTAFNAHTHTTTTVGNPTSTPITPWTSSTIKSIYTKAGG